MGTARHPKPYKRGKRQVTMPWKKRVLAKLEENKAAGEKPCNRDQLGSFVGAAKGSMNTLLDLEKEPPQLTSGYVAEICEALKLEEPLLEQEGDTEDFIRDVRILRSLSPEDRRDVMVWANRLAKKP